MKVKLTYFQQNGKYYTEAELEMDGNRPLFMIWQDIKEMFKDGKRPGLIDAPQEFNTLVEVPEHPHAHPVIIMASEVQP